MRRDAHHPVACAGAVAGLLALAAPAAALAQDARTPASYDGRWSVTLVCDDLKEEGRVVKGYEYRFFVDVRNGHLEGQYKAPGSPGSLTMTGTVVPDGGLQITADGITRHSEYTVGRVAQGTHYTYTMEGRLSGTAGSARRRELRPCAASFAKPS